MTFRFRKFLGFGFGRVNLSTGGASLSVGGRANVIKGLVFFGILYWLLTTFAGAAQAQSSVTKSFYSHDGSFAGSSVTRGNSDSFYDGQGRFSGSSLGVGNQTLYYDYQGRYSGSAINTGPRR